MDDISIVIILLVFMVAFGYVAGSARSFNFVKLLLLAFIALPFIYQTSDNRDYLFLTVGAFAFGFFLPYAHFLYGLFDSLNDFINRIRYRSVYEDILRKEAEIDELHRQYEQAQREANRVKQEYEQARRREESRQYRQNQEQQKQQSQGSQNRQKEQSSSGSNYQQGQQNRQSSSQRQYADPKAMVRKNYLKALKLDPEKEYSFDEIRLAYRRAAMKYHPDRNRGKGEEVLKEMGEKFKVIQAAYEWLKKNH